MRYVLLIILTSFLVSSAFYKNLLAADLLGSADNSVQKRVQLKSKALDLHIQIDEANLQSIRAVQEKAKKDNFYLSKKKDSVKVQISLGRGEKIESKIRLRDRWEEPQNIHEWALRISLKTDDRYILGMRKFMLKPGGERWDHREALLSLHLRLAGVIAPRIIPIQLYVNDRHVGAMVIEEVLAKEMLENNRKKDNPVVLFNNRLHREQLAHNLRTDSMVFSMKSGSLRHTQFTGPKDMFSETIGFSFAPVDIVSHKRSKKKTL